MTLAGAIAAHYVDTATTWAAFITGRGAALLAWYRLGESSASGGAVDSSGNGRTLTYRASSITYGVAGSVAGDSDTAVTFAVALGAGSTSYIAHGTSGSYLDGLSALTLVAAVKMPSSSATGFLLNSMDAAAAGNGRCFIDVATGVARCNFYTTGSVQHSLTGVTSVKDNAWHLVIAVFNGATGAVDLYIGNTDGTVIHDGTRTDGGTPLTIQTPGTDRGVTVGGRPDGASFDAENIYSEDEAVIFNEAWSSTDVANAVHAWAGV